MKSAWCFVGLAFFVMLGVACAKRQSQLPAPVAQGIEQLSRLCSDAGGTPSADQALLRADLNADGLEDYVLHADGMRCEGAASVYGDRENIVTVFVGDADGGSVKAFDDQVFEMRMEAGAATKLWLTVHGEQCGKPPARDFASESFCERAIEWDATRQRFEYAPVGSVRPIQ